MKNISKITAKLPKMNQRKVFLCSITFNMLLVAVYLFSVPSIILNTSERSQIEHDAEILRYEIGELEFNLISEKGNINLELANSIGFSSTQDVKFISRNDSVTAINFQSQE